MASLSVQAVRDRIDDYLVAGSYVRSRWSFDLFGKDTQYLLHKSFAVGCPQTGFTPPDDRRRLSAVGIADTVVIVKTAYQLKGDDQVADYDLGLGHEQAVIQRVLGLSTTDLWIRLLAVDLRQVSPTGEWFTTTIRFSVQHRYAYV